MEKKEKQKEIERILPLSWNSYQHMYESRVNSIQNGSNFLLVVISFFTTISISFFDYYNQNLFFIPFIIQIIALFCLTKIYFLKSPVHWFKIDEVIKDLQNRTFNEKFLSDLKGLEEDTHIYLQEARKIIRNVLSLLILSFYSAAIILLDPHINLWIILPLSLVFILLFLIWITYLEKEPSWGYNRVVKNSLSQIESWYNN